MLASTIQLILQYTLRLCFFALQPDVLALYLYDAISMYMTFADAVVRAGLDYKNGKIVYSHAQNRNFKG